MKSYNFKKIFFCFLLIFSLRLFSFSEPLNPDFEPFFNETLKYKISWFGIYAGDAIISISLASYHNKKVIKFTGTVSSARWFSRIYYVEDKVTTLVDSETLKPYKITVNYKEGKHYKRNAEYYFDYEKNILFSNNRQSASSKLIKGSFMDMFSAFYFMRCFDFSRQNSFSVTVSDGRKFYQISAVKAGSKTIKSILGKKECLEIKPGQIQFNLTGKKQNPDDLSMFLTDDSKRIPVLITGDIRIGTIVAKLQSVDN